jgi:hypothetical protein
MSPARTIPPTNLDLPKVQLRFQTRHYRHMSVKDRRQLTSDARVEALRSVLLRVEVSQPELLQVGGLGCSTTFSIANPNYRLYWARW